ncbi:KaiC domain-containing protein [Haloarchaeobius sp. TZWSO28]|uniref:KaiC domain-containing protein n=1 Tax=Haloarchaeobius sp. TZWSO28 TaxID=3446119 RepID=UPI003EBC2EEC
MVTVSDEDWFERAIRERNQRSDTADGGGEDEGDDATDPDDSAWDDEWPDDMSAEEAAADAVAEAGTESDSVSDPPANPDADGPANDNSPAGTPDSSPAEDPDGASGSGSLFNDNFGAAMENVQMPDVDDDGGSGGAGDSFDVDGSPFDVGNGEFDMATDDFGMSAGFDSGGGGFGGGDFGGEEFDSDLPRINLGITGLDEMIMGGVPERSLMVAVGSAGTGKTTFGLQFLDHGLRQGERGIFITLEENRRRVINSATEKGMPFDEYVADDLLAVVDIDPIEMANSLGSIRSELPRLIREFGASRLVLDSVSLLEMMYDDRAKRRNEIFDFTKSLKEAGITTMMTSEASEDSPYASRHGIVEYLTDAVFILQYVRPSDFRETRLAVEIQKIRDANHSRETKPYEITDEGISVHRQANIF